MNRTHPLLRSFRRLSVKARVVLAFLAAGAGGALAAATGGALAAVLAAGGMAGYLFCFASVLDGPTVTRSEFDEEEEPADRDTD